MIDRITVAVAAAAVLVAVTGPALGDGKVRPAELGKILERAYEDAIYQAAVKRPDFVVRLTPIDPTHPATVITLTRRNPIDANQRLYGDTWVSLPSDLKPRCYGRPDAVLALEQVLGIPPDRTAADHAARFLVQFTVQPSDVFRPCASSGDTTTQSCSLDLPTPSSEAAKAEQARTQQFVFAQMWNSYRAKFGNRAGYPFTGMGWSYDWNPTSPTHVGISEYVVRGGAAVAAVSQIDPVRFCSSR